MTRVSEPSQSQPQLHGIDAGIKFFKAGIRDMHEADVSCPIHFPSQKMEADRPGGREVNARGSGRGLGIGKQRPPSKVDVGHDASVRIEIPDQREGIYRGPIGRIRRLKKYEDGHGIDGILEAPAQEAWTVRSRYHPAVAKARGPNSGMLRRTVRSVSPRSPKFDFVPIGFRSVLGAQR